MIVAGLGLTPPFSKEYALSTALPIYPILVRTESRLIRPHEDEEHFLKATLQTPKLDRIYKHLWLAGLPKAARPLHRQKLLGRELVLTEHADEHLVWHQRRMIVKPLPEYLLNTQYWERTLCADQALHKSACGLLISYAWLVSYESDLKIAKDIGLLPAGIRWQEWTWFLGDLLRNINIDTLEQVDQRYHYGELRLNRLNAIYRVFPAVSSFTTLIRGGGFMSSSTWQSSLFRRNFAWLLTVLVYLTVILSALQVGLATEMLQQDAAFAWASYGFCVASILIILLIMGTVLFVWFILFWFHVISTLRYTENVKKARIRGRALDPS
jgi:uncharacterized membrane protein